MKNTHTPGPWSLSGDRYIVAPDSELIADCFKESQEDVANAAFIVRACNAHDELVAALRDAYAHITLLGSGNKPPSSNAEMCVILGDVLTRTENQVNPKLDYYCKKCASRDVFRDASAKWDITSQQWVLASVHDHADCSQCNSDSNLQEVDLNKEP